jgi:hypothetical protein
VVYNSNLYLGVCCNTHTVSDSVADLYIANYLQPRQVSSSTEHIYEYFHSFSIYSLIFLYGGCESEIIGIHVSTLIVQAPIIKSRKLPVGERLISSRSLRAYIAIV